MAHENHQISIMKSFIGSKDLIRDYEQYFRVPTDPYTQYIQFTNEARVNSAMYYLVVTDMNCRACIAKKREMGWNNTNAGTFSLFDDNDNNNKIIVYTTKGHSIPSWMHLLEIESFPSYFVYNTTIQKWEPTEKSTKTIEILNEIKNENIILYEIMGGMFEIHISISTMLSDLEIAPYYEQLLNRTHRVDEWSENDCNDLYELLIETERILNIYEKHKDTITLLVGTIRLTLQQIMENFFIANSFSSFDVKAHEGEEAVVYKLCWFVREITFLKNAKETYDKIKLLVKTSSPCGKRF